MRWFLVAFGLAGLTGQPQAQSPIPNDPFRDVPAPVVRPRPVEQVAPLPAQQAQNAPLPPRLVEGQAALARRDFAAAEAAARAVIASREATQDVYMLLGDALIGRRDFPGAAVAYDDARRRSPTGPRSAEAIIGVANAFIGLNQNHLACEVLNALRSARPNLSGPLAERTADARHRADCR